MRYGRDYRQFYSVIKVGNVRKIKELCKENFSGNKGLGVLSKKELQNMKYHLGITLTLISRYCIEGGLDLSTSCELASQGKNYSIHVVRCIDYMYDNLHSQITVEYLAKRCNLPSSYLSRLFKKETGVSVSKYIIQLKVEAAKNMLLHSDLTLSDVSIILAFGEQSYFTSVFRKHTGFAPRKYQALHLREMSLREREKNKVCFF